MRSISIFPGFQCGLLGRHQAEHHGAVVGDVLQRREAARTLVVVFEQEATEVGAAEDLLRDRVVAAAGVVLALVVAPAEVDAEGDAGMVADHGVVEFDAAVEQPVRVVAALAVALADGRVEQPGILRRVELDVGAAEADQFGDLGAQDIHHIGEVGIDRRVGALRFLRVVVGRRLLRADQRRLPGAVADAGAQVGELFGAQVPHAA